MLPSCNDLHLDPLTRLENECDIMEQALNLGRRPSSAVIGPDSDIDHDCLALAFCVSEPVDLLHEACQVGQVGAACCQVRT
jgi:hypothetical protein